MTLVYALLLVVGVVLLAVTAVRVLVGGLADGAGQRPPRRRTTSGHARQVLDERYAAGELTTEEYQHRLRVLEEGDE